MQEGCQSWQNRNSGDPHFSFDERIMVRLRALCDVHFRLSVEKFGQKLLKTLEVCKVHNAELDTGKIVNFDVKPGFGIQISPMNRATI